VGGENPKGEKRELREFARFWGPLMKTEKGEKGVIEQSRNQRSRVK